MSSAPSWSCPRTESCERSTAAGSMLPDLRRRMHVRRTLSSSAELQGRHEQTTEFNLQHRNLRRARINMQGPVRASLCTSSDTVWTGCAVPQAANAADHESSRWRASIFLHRKASLPQHSLHAADDQEHQDSRVIVTVRSIQLHFNILATSCWQ